MLELGLSGLLVLIVPSLSLDSTLPLNVVIESGAWAADKINSGELGKEA